MKPRGRYAPSPTGRLHYGNLRTALLAWLQIRLLGGEFILRIDDLDAFRNKPGAVEQVIDDLKWMGLDWDFGPDSPRGERYLQSNRLRFYEEAFNQLAANGLIFPCTCSRRDIAEAISAPHDSHISVYPGTCRHRQFSKPSMDQPAQAAQDHAWRIRVDNAAVVVNDRLAGNIEQSLASAVGDFVVKRKDGLFAYQLATVVDDGLMGITDIVRGEDLLYSAPRQAWLFDLLGYERPSFWHVPLMRDANHQRLAKRDGSHSLEQWQKSNRSANELVGVMAYQLGLINEPVALSPQTLLDRMEINQFTHALSCR